MLPWSIIIGIGIGGDALRGCTDCSEIYLVLSDLVIVILLFYLACLLCLTQILSLPFPSSECHKTYTVSIIGLEPTRPGYQAWVHSSDQTNPQVKCLIHKYRYSCHISCFTLCHWTPGPVVRYLHKSINKSITTFNGETIPLTEQWVHTMPPAFLFKFTEVSKVESIKTA